MPHTIHITVENPHYYNSPLWGGGFVQRKEADDISATVECPGCDGWQECDEDHGTHGVDDCLLLDGEGCYCDPCEGDEFEFHGILHTFNWTGGWTVPYPGCVVRVNDSVYDFACDTAYTYGPGSYLVEDDWTDYDVYLTAVSMADGSPLPEEDVWWEANAEKPKE